MRKKAHNTTGRDREGFTVEVVPAPEADISALDAARAILVREVLRRLEARREDGAEDALILPLDIPGISW